MWAIITPECNEIPNECPGCQSLIVEKRSMYALVNAFQYFDCSFRGMIGPRLLRIPEGLRLFHCGGIGAGGIWARCTCASVNREGGQLRQWRWVDRLDVCRNFWSIAGSHVIHPVPRIVGILAFIDLKIFHPLLFPRVLRGGKATISCEHWTLAKLTASQYHRMYKPAPPRPKKTNIVRSRNGCKSCRRRRTKVYFLTALASYPADLDNPVWWEAANVWDLY